MPASFDNELFRELIEKWPETALQYLHKRFYRKLVYISQQRTNNRQASEDIVQDVIISVWAKIDQLIKGEGFLIAPYLLRLVKLKSITFYYQSNKIENRASNHFDELLSSASSAEDDLILSDTQNRLRNLVDRLPSRVRECVQMRYFEAMSNDAIARQLGLSKKTVEKRLTTGLKLLRKQKERIY